MGGNLFNLGRLPRADYLNLEAELRTYLDRRLGPEHYRIPRSYGSKPDFGDMDIVVSEAAAVPSWIVLREQIISELGIARHTSNKAVFSTVYRDFQVDYFLRPPRTFLSTYRFLCYNDLGNLLGRIFHRMGLKYGEDGLQYVYRREDVDSYRHDLDISQDLGKILDFIGLEVERWEAGFETLEEMFAWVVSSPYFSAHPYLDPGSTTRRRARHRTTVRRFIEWLEASGIQRTWEPPEGGPLPAVLAAFPEADLPTALAWEEEKAARAAILRERFNGHRVQALFPQLSGAALGHFMRSFREAVPDFEEWLLSASGEDIADRLRAHAQKQEGE